jgi:hypothetical protein
MLIISQTQTIHSGELPKHQLASPPKPQPAMGSLFHIDENSNKETQTHEEKKEVSNVTDLFSGCDDSRMIGRNDMFNSPEKKFNIDASFVTINNPDGMSSPDQFSTF